MALNTDFEAGYREAWEKYAGIGGALRGALVGGAMTGLPAAALTAMIPRNKGYDLASGDTRGGDALSAGLWAGIPGALTGGLLGHARQDIARQEAAQLDVLRRSAAQRGAPPPRSPFDRPPAPTPRAPSAPSEMPGAPVLNGTERFQGLDVDDPGFIRIRGMRVPAPTASPPSTGPDPYDITHRMRGLDVD